MCQDKIKIRCKKNYANCINYETAVPSFSSLVEDDCISIEETTTDIYELITGIKTNLNLTTVTHNCLSSPLPTTVSSMIQLLIDTLCTMKETITTQGDQIQTLQTAVQNLQTNTCP